MARAKAALLDVCGDQNERLRQYMPAVGTASRIAAPAGGLQNVLRQRRAAGFAVALPAAGFLAASPLGGMAKQIAEHQRSAAKFNVPRGIRAAAALERLDVSKFLPAQERGRYSKLINAAQLPARVPPVPRVERPRPDLAALERNAAEAREQRRRRDDEFRSLIMRIAQAAEEQVQEARVGQSRAEARTAEAETGQAAERDRHEAREAARDKRQRIMLVVACASPPLSISGSIVLRLFGL